MSNGVVREEKDIVEQNNRNRREKTLAQTRTHILSRIRNLHHSSNSTQKMPEKKQQVIYFPTDLQMTSNSKPYSDIDIKAKSGVNQIYILTFITYL